MCKTVWIVCVIKKKKKVLVAKKPKMPMFFYTLTLIPILPLIIKVLFSFYQGKLRATLFMLGELQ